ncbi:MAG: TauD/TfdA family dioxygenase [Alphaproteobacteria bacterium]|nr:TauD/TfdA family dioxygenase [Alphaproteobacteria bacterium]
MDDFSFDGFQISGRQSNGVGRSQKLALSDSDRASLVVLCTASEWPDHALRAETVDEHAAAAQRILDRCPDAAANLHRLVSPILDPSANLVHLPSLFPPVAVATPVGSHLADDMLIIAQLRLLTIALVAGGHMPTAYPHENDGRIARNVRPDPCDAGERSSHGGKVDFEWHSDNPSDRAPGHGGGALELPAWLVFHGQRNFEKAVTEVVHLADIVTAFERKWPGEIGRLMRPDFLFSPPESIRLHHGAMEPVLLPVLWFDDKAQLQVRWDTGCMKGIDQEAEWWLFRFRESICAAAAEHGKSFVIGPGDFFAFDNRRILHGRRRFKAFPPPTARWLLRVYGKPIDQPLV